MLSNYFMAKFKNKPYEKLHQERWNLAPKLGGVQHLATQHSIVPYYKNLLDQVTLTSWAVTCEPWERQRMCWNCTVQAAMLCKQGPNWSGHVPHALRIYKVEHWETQNVHLQYLPSICVHSSCWPQSQQLRTRHICCSCVETIWAHLSPLPIQLHLKSSCCWIATNQPQATSITVTAVHD